MSLSEFRRATSKPVKTRASGIWGLNKPSEYSKLHLALNQVGPRSPLGELFSNGRAMHAVPLVNRTFREVLPGVKSFDAPFMHFHGANVRDWNRVFKVSLDDDGFTPNGIASNFDKLLCPAGWLQTPMSAKVVDNAVIREELKLSVGYSAEQHAIATAVWKRVWSRATPSAVNVPKASAGGMRRFSHDVQWKLDFARWKTEPANYDRFLRYVESNAVYNLANEFEIVYGMYVQKRLQLDSVGKVRYANDWLFAKTGGRRGQRAETDKRVTLPGGDWSEWSAQRVRVIDAGPWSINCDLQIVASAHMKALFHDYPSVFHVNTDEQITAIVNGKYIYCSDVSEYDQSMSKDAIKVIFSTMREYYPEGVVRSAERLYAGPYYAKPLAVDGTACGWIFNPMDWSQQMQSGNRSGHAMTSLVAKVNKVIDTLFVLSRIYPVTVDNIDTWFRGGMPMGFINNGDDEVIWALARDDMRRFAELRVDRSVGHYAVEPEAGMGFSGRLLSKPNPNELVYVPVGRLQTPIEKMYVPERSIGGVMRPFWPVGWLDRIDTLHQTDAGRELWEIHNHNYRKLMEPHYGVNWKKLVLDAYGRLDSRLAGFTAVEREVLVDPDKLHYKFSDSDVSSTVLNMITSNIPATYCEGWLRRYYTGTIV